MFLCHSKFLPKRFDFWRRCFIHLIKDHYLYLQWRFFLVTSNSCLCFSLYLVIATRVTLVFFLISKWSPKSLFVGSQAIDLFDLMRGPFLVKLMTKISGDIFISLKKVVSVSLTSLFYVSSWRFTIISLKNWIKEEVVIYGI